MPVAELGLRLGREEIHVEGVEDELHEFREKPGIEGLPGDPEAGPAEKLPESGQSVAFPLVPVEFELQADGRADFLHEDERPGPGDDEEQLPARNENAGDLGGGFEVVVHVLQEIETEHAVEGPALERKAGRAHLDEAPAEELPAGQKIFEVQVGMNPPSAFLLQEPAEDSLGAAEVETAVLRPDIDLLLDQVDFFPFLQGTAGDFELPRGFVGHVRHYIPSPAGRKTGSRPT